jgi:ribokinase
VKKSSSNVVIVGISGESVFLETDHFHREGETISALNKITEPGGKGYNQAVASSVLGANVTFLTTIGNDAYGRYAVEYLKNNHINVKYRIIEDIPTAYATILTDKFGKNQVTVFSGASSCLNKNDVSLIEEDIKEADYVLLQLEVSKEVLLEVIKIAKKNNVKVILNPAPAKFSIDDELYKKIDIITPNEVEARDIFGIPESLSIFEYGEYLKYKVNNVVIITLGDNGCLLVKNNYYKYFDPIRVEVVDSTGAGDVFNASLVTMLSYGYDIEEAILFAVKVSAESVTKKYVMNAINSLRKYKIN